MLCPKCQSQLQSVTNQGETLSSCPSCAGFWIGRQTLIELMRRAAEALGEEIKAVGFTETPSVTTALPCPDCGTALSTLHYRAIQVERCPTCKGVFLDAGELKALADRVVSSQQQWRIEEEEWARLSDRLRGQRGLVNSEAIRSAADVGLLIGVGFFSS